MARHETVNKRLNHLEIFNQRFKNSLDRHSINFHAVANITQLQARRVQYGDLG